MEKLKYAQDIFKRIGSSAGCGFNQFVMGAPNPDTSYHDYSSRLTGYMKGEEMAREGKIYYTHIFKCKCGGYPFMYGGFFVCNSCGGKGVNHEWWEIKTTENKNGWTVEGLSSGKIATGKTKGEALSRYEKLFKN